MTTYNSTLLSAKRLNDSVVAIHSMESKTYNEFHSAIDPQLCSISYVSSVTGDTSDLASNNTHTINTESSIAVKNLRVQKNTLGNKNIVHHAERRMKRKLQNDNNEVFSDIYDEEKLFEILCSTTTCCKKNSNSGGCIRTNFASHEKSFPTNKNSSLFLMMNFIKRARAERGKLFGDKLDNFIQEKLRSVICGEKNSKMEIFNMIFVGAMRVFRYAEIPTQPYSEFQNIGWMHARLPLSYLTTGG
jgi:hypothetical protein